MTTLDSIQQAAKDHAANLADNQRRAYCQVALIARLRAQNEVFRRELNRLMDVTCSIDCEAIGSVLSANPTI